mmetsp:Transcript_1522/g.4190  ORF Transcript_1522/g.4190 Transcript_1522/m.4190 type:complete len:233 (-) Transcript_1522:162-860(-)|eukprot:CAMPEP_0194478868 /NCGR_PEP_ID=MMETSP0253-20130528/2178_1 /TAXON_ID=2966 /ORGANISM="Noctiluca scintillans" /LENGTH=232 /DNA_ID=CAMNT_0039318019 /DNA_START=46 /DNA_END=744 /DNA_ORIENTATION=-
MGGQQSTPGGPQDAQPAQPRYGDAPAAQAPKGNNKVQLAVSPLGGVPGATAYHSSIVVNDEEFFFSDSGVTSARGLMSHQNPQNPNSTPTVFDMGMSQYSGNSLKSALERHFLAGTYDLLRKNCNSFSDVALFYLLHKRLDPQYRALEKLGQRAGSMMTQLSGGQYTPNPKCDGFDIEQLILDIDPEKVWSTPGQSTGGTAASSAADMRAARLARFAQQSATPGTDGTTGST